ncbi:hypothetical protein KCU85_g5096, partial [Aureobasidium melanogenum]
MASSDAGNAYRLSSDSEYYLAPERPMSVDLPTLSTGYRSVLHQPSPTTKDFENRADFFESRNNISSFMPSGRIDSERNSSAQPRSPLASGTDNKSANLVHGSFQKLLWEEQERLAAQIAGDYDMALHLQEEEDSRRVAESQTLTRDCAVCCESCHVLEFPVRPPSSHCTHLAEVCSACLQQWVATKIDANARATIDCPQCTTLLNHEDVRRACRNPETFARYDRFATRAIIDDLRDFHWCLRVGCTGGQEQVGGLGYMKCHSCNYEQCLHHKTEWHHGESCRQYDARLRNQTERMTHEQEERETTRFMAQQQNSTVWKKCPKCQVLIEKTDGCDQMKCRAKNCRQKFCWECLATWEDMLKHKDKAHAVTCKYRTRERYPYGYNG